MALKNIIRFSTPALLFTAFLLLLLVSVSMPIAKPVWILEIASTPPAYEPKTSIATQVRFGLWGYCASAYEFGYGGDLQKAEHQDMSDVFAAFCLAM